MRHTITIPLLPELNVLESNIPSCSMLNYIQIDLHKLIDNHQAVLDVVKENKNRLSFGEFITICDWLYAWYKKIDHPILSNRILNSFQNTLYFITCKY